MQSSISTLPSVHTEHAVLCRSLGDVQARCSRIMGEQRAEIDSLQAQVMRLRAQLVLAKTRLAWAPGSVSNRRFEPTLGNAPNAIAAHPLASAACASFRAEWAETNEVICQVACESHGAFWRDAKDQCQRSGQDCVVTTAASAMKRLTAEVDSESLSKNSR